MQIPENKLLLNNTYNNNLCCSYIHVYTHGKKDSGLLITESLISHGLEQVHFQFCSFIK